MEFVDTLRARSNYPFLRGVVRAFMMVGYLAALVSALAGLFVFATPSPNISTALLGCMLLLGAVLLVVLAHLARELMLMLADIADGVLAIAEYQSQSLPPSANTDWG